MRDKIILALALLLAASLAGFAAAAADPLSLPFPAAGSEPAPLAFCAAAPATAAPQALPPNPATELGVGDDALTCSSDCGSLLCRGELPGTVCGAYPKIGACNMTSNFCSADGRYSCYCKYS